METLVKVPAKRLSTSAEVKKLPEVATPRPSVAPAATVVVPVAGLALVFKKVSVPVFTLVPPL